MYYSGGNIPQEKGELWRVNMSPEFGNSVEGDKNAGWKGENIFFLRNFDLPRRETRRDGLKDPGGQKRPRFAATAHEILGGIPLGKKTKVTTTNAASSDPRRAHRTC